MLIEIEHLFHPLTTADGNIDEVVRVCYDIDSSEFVATSGRTVGELKGHLLAHRNQAARLGRALTAVMAAALAKLCDVHELIAIAEAISRPTKSKGVMLILEHQAARNRLEALVNS